jgi:hypothetical protein
MANETTDDIRDDGDRGSDRGSDRTDRAAAADGLSRAQRAELQGQQQQQSADGAQLASASGPVQRRAGAEQLNKQLEDYNVTPSDVKVTENGVQLTEQAQRERAAQQLNETTEIEVTSSDLEQSESGYELTALAAQEEAAARSETYSPDEFVVEDDAVRVSDQAQLEQAVSELNSQNQTTVTAEDVTQAEDGFTLTNAAAREEAAAVSETYSTGDFTIEDDSVTVTDQARREQAASKLDAQNSIDVTPADITEREDGFALTNAAARREAAADSESYSPDDFIVEGDSVVVSDQAQQQQAVSELDSQNTIDVTAGDIMQTEDGFSLTDAAARREAAAESETFSAGDFIVQGDSVALSDQAARAQLNESTRTELDADDITETEGGFGLTDEAARIESAADLDAQTDTEISPGDLTETGDGFALTEQAQREEAAAGIEGVSPDQLVKDGDAFRIPKSAQRQQALSELQSQTDTQLTADDLTETNSGFALTEQAQREETAADVSWAEASDILISGDEARVKPDALVERAASQSAQYSESAFTVGDGEPVVKSGAQEREAREAALASVVAGSDTLLGALQDEGALSSQQISQIESVGSVTELPESLEETLADRSPVPGRDVEADGAEATITDTGRKEAAATIASLENDSSFTAGDFTIGEDGTPQITTEAQREQVASQSEVFGPSDILISGDEARVKPDALVEQAASQSDQFSQSDISLEDGDPVVKSGAKEREAQEAVQASVIANNPVLVQSLFQDDTLTFDQTLDVLGADSVTELPESLEETLADRSPVPGREVQADGTEASITDAGQKEAAATIASLENELNFVAGDFTTTDDGIDYSPQGARKVAAQQASEQRGLDIIASDIIKTPDGFEVSASRFNSRSADGEVDGYITPDWAESWRADHPNYEQPGLSPAERRAATEQAADTLDEQIASMDVSEDDIQQTELADGTQAFTLDGDAQSTVETRRAAGLIGGTTEQQRTQIALDDPALDAAAAIGGATEEQRTQIAFNDPTLDAAAAIGGTTEEQRTQITVNDPVLDAAAAIGGTTEAQRNRIELNDPALDAPAALGDGTVRAEETTTGVGDVPTATTSDEFFDSVSNFANSPVEGVLGPPGRTEQALTGAVDEGLSVVAGPPGEIERTIQSEFFDVAAPVTGAPGELEQDIREPLADVGSAALDVTAGAVDDTVDASADAVDAVLGPPGDIEQAIYSAGSDVAAGAADVADAAGDFASPVLDPAVAAGEEAIDAGTDVAQPVIGPAGNVEQDIGEAAADIGASATDEVADAVGQLESELQPVLGAPGDIEAGVGDVVFGVADASRDIADFTGENITDPIAGALGDIAAGTTGAVTGEDDGAVASSVGSATESLTEGVGTGIEMLVAGPDTLVNLGTTAGSAAEYTANEISEEGFIGGAEESIDAATNTAVTVGAQALGNAQSKPLFTLGTLIGTAGTIGAASRVSSTLGRGTAVAIQPGEELATALGSRALGGTRLLDNSIMRGRLDNEEPALRAASAAGSRIRDADGVRDVFPDVDTPNVRVSLEANPEAGRLDVRGGGGFGDRIRQLPEAAGERASQLRGEGAQRVARTRRDLSELPQRASEEVRLTASEIEAGIEDAGISTRRIRERSPEAVTRGQQELSLGLAEAQDILSGGADSVADTLRFASQQADLSSARVRRELSNLPSGIEQSARLGLGRAGATLSDGADSVQQRLGNIDENVESARTTISEMAETTRQSADLTGRRLVRDASEILPRAEQSARLGVRQGEDAASNIFESTADSLGDLQDAPRTAVQSAEIGARRTVRDISELLTAVDQSARLGAQEAGFRAMRGVESGQDTVAGVFERANRAIENAPRRAELALLRGRERARDVRGTLGVTRSQLSDATLSIEIGQPPRRFDPETEFGFESEQESDSDSDDPFGFESAQEGDTDTVIAEGDDGAIEIFSESEQDLGDGTVTVEQSRGSSGGRTESESEAGEGAESDGVVFRTEPASGADTGDGVPTNGLSGGTQSSLDGILDEFLNSDAGASNSVTEDGGSDPELSVGEPVSTGSEEAVSPFEDPQGAVTDPGLVVPSVTRQQELTVSGVTDGAQRRQQEAETPVFREDERTFGVETGVFGSESSQDSDIGLELFDAERIDEVPRQDSRQPPQQDSDDGTELGTENAAEFEFEPETAESEWVGFETDVRDEVELEAEFESESEKERERELFGGGDDGFSDTTPGVEAEDDTFSSGLADAEEAAGELFDTDDESGGGFL